MPRTDHIPFALHPQGGLASKECLLLLSSPASEAASALAQIEEVRWVMASQGPTVVDASI